MRAAALLLILLGAAAAAAESPAASFGALGRVPFGSARRGAGAPRRLGGGWSSRRTLERLRAAHAADFLREARRQQEARFASARGEPAGPAPETPETPETPKTPETPTTPTTPTVSLDPEYDNECAHIDPCRACVFVMERLRRATNVLPAVVEREVLGRFPDWHSCARRLVGQLDEEGGQVRAMLYKGCYKAEIYGGAREWVSPCPSHVVCGRLLAAPQQPYCAAPRAENPFAA